MRTHQKVHTISQGRTHRATAEAIYEHLRAHPEDWPTDPPRDHAEQDSAGHYRLIIKIEGTDAHLRFGELTDSWLDVFPNVTWSEDTLSRGAMFLKDRLMSDAVEDREHVTAYIRTVLMRALRYDAKRAARLAEIERRDALADA